MKILKFFIELFFYESWISWVWTHDMRRLWRLLWRFMKTFLWGFMPQNLKSKKKSRYTLSTPPLECYVLYNISRIFLKIHKNIFMNAYRIDPRHICSCSITAKLMYCVKKKEDRGGVKKRFHLWWSEHETVFLKDTNQPF